MTDEDRITACGDDIETALKKYDCLMTVPEIFLRNGEMYPVVRIHINPKPKPAPDNGPTKPEPTITDAQRKFAGSAS